MINRSLFQNYFVLRMTEMMHKDTLDSYRVRVHNTLSILIELSNVLEGWLNGNVKHFITVNYCIEESLSLLESDDSLTFQDYSKDLLKKQLITYRDNSKQKSSKEDKAKENNNVKSGKDIPLVNETYDLKYTIDSIIKNDKERYFINLLDNIKTYLFTEEEYEDDKFTEVYRNIDTLLSSFGTELLRIGYSKKYLYSYFMSMKNNLHKVTFEDAFNKMYHEFSIHSRKEFAVIIKLSFTNSFFASIASDKIEGIENAVFEELKANITAHNSYKRTNSQTRYYILKTQALDPPAAARIGYERLSEMLDANQDIIKGIHIPDQALVLALDDGIPQKESTENFYILDSGGKFATESEVLLHTILNEIKSSKLIQHDVKDRIESALRHLRIGDSQIEIEQQFINYWIALEFIFSSGERNSSTFERIKTYLVEILSVCYVRRNEMYLHHWFVGSKHINESDNIFDKVNDDEFISSLSSSLEKFRAINFKSHIHAKDKTNSYIQTHKEHLLQHISRIYRLRNELVHEAAIKQDIANVTSNLRFYLIFVMNQLLGFCINEIHNSNDVSMRKFFWLYDKWDKFIKEVNAKEGALQVPIAKNYIS